VRQTYVVRSSTFDGPDPTSSQTPSSIPLSTGSLRSPKLAFVDPFQIMYVYPISSRNVERKKNDVFYCPGAPIVFFFFAVGVRAPHVVNSVCIQKLLNWD